VLQKDGTTDANSVKQIKEEKTRISGYASDSHVKVLASKEKNRLSVLRQGIYMSYMLNDECK
jgi:hypothetical protein